MFKIFLQSFINLLFPKTCVACTNLLAGNEEYICTTCLSKLAQTRFWNKELNPIAKIFWGRVQIENATSFLYFEKDSTLQHILHHLKYKNKPEIGIILGKLFGAKLIGTPYSQTDYIVPVPLHKKREKERGYNQSACIAKGISHCINVPVLDKAVQRTKQTKTQTNKTRFDRWLNVENVFKVTSPEEIKNKHILVVDDVITTGATTESLIQELLKIKGVRVSLAVIASA